MRYIETLHRMLKSIAVLIFEITTKNLTERHETEMNRA